jgi:hypothetical protein
MSKIGTKASNFFEEHIEKVVLGVVGLVCMWLLLTRVLFSPNVVAYDAKEFSPSEIDPYIKSQADAIKLKLEQPAKAEPPYKPQVDDFLAKMDSAIDVDATLYPPLPSHTSMAVVANKKYEMPQIGEVTDVAVEHLRAAAYVPTAPITPQNTYDKSITEPNDIDLVTVEAKFDVAALYQELRRCFASEDVPIEWRDPCLANPVFAAVQLQRQELLEDGGWSDWQSVPRAKIDHRKRMFEVVEAEQELPPGGIKVQLLQFDNPDVRVDLLQPTAYQIASANVEWFPPSLHRRFVDLQAKEIMEEKRKAKEDEKKEEEQNRLDSRRGATAATRSGPGRTGRTTYDAYQSTQGQGLYGTSQRRPRSRTTDRGVPGRAEAGPGLYDDSGLYGAPGDRGARPRGRSRADERDIGTEYLPGGREIPREPTSSDIYYELDDALITRRTDLAKMREPLLFWAFDDTAEPKKTYQYRIRLGVFNPVAGATAPNKQDASQRNQVVLWSNFSDVTQLVHIPARLYFFANDVQEAGKTVSVQVSKYVLGYWHSEEFRVRPGEVIGKTIQTERPEDKNPIRDRRLPLAAMDAFMPTKEQPVVPEMIDYGTGAVLVDAVPVNDWTGPGPLRPRNYHDMLYTYGGTEIERMPIKPRNWPEGLLAAYYDIQRAQREPPEPFRAWNSRLGKKQRPMGLEPYEDMGTEDYMMMEEMMMMGERGRR